MTMGSIQYSPNNTAADEDNSLVKNGDVVELVHIRSSKLLNR